MEERPNSSGIVPNEEDNNISECCDNMKTIVSGLMSIKEVIDTLICVNSISDFVHFKKQINEYLINYFHPELEDKTEDFCLAFSQGNVSKFLKGTVEEKKELKIFLQEKNNIYLNIIKESIDRGKLDNLLKQEEKDDVVKLIKSGVFQCWDNTYINWFNEVYKEENKNIKTDKLVYGGVKDGQIMPYRDFAGINNICISPELFKNINNSDLKTYFTTIYGFFQEGVYDYDSWVGAEVSETNTWKDRDSIFGLITPMEDYIYPGVLIEPEIIIFLKDLTKKYDHKKYSQLSKEYFLDNYGMDMMTIDFVETLLEGGESTFSGFIGKAFPNDKNLSKKEGNSIIIKNNSMLDVVNNSRDGFEKLFGKDIGFNEEILYNELIKEVTYHEFGHSLFIKGHPSSNLEELKATLFYYLQVCLENKEKAYLQEDIEKIIKFSIMDSIRNLERIGESKSKKYVILTKCILSNLFDSGLLYWENNLLNMNSDNDKFREFLDCLKKELYKIKYLYTFNKKQLEKEEKIILNNLDYSVMEDINKMINLISS